MLNNFFISLLRWKCNANWYESISCIYKQLCEFYRSQNRKEGDIIKTEEMGFMMEEINGVKTYLVGISIFIFLCTSIIVYLVALRI